MDAMPQRIIATGPYRYTRNPMYLGHIIFMAGLVLTFRRGLHSSCLSPADFGFSAGFCRTRLGWNECSLLNIPRIEST
ncbi:MAG TPA: methyltransferase [Xanthobacteraceae bacterium]|nr:methyltransferase [Xanthobacteraceae bacterium]